MTGARAACAALLALALLGCSHMPSGAPLPGPDEGRWAALREGATRHARLYDGLAMRALGNATWHSPEVREARAERVAAWKAMSDAEREALLATERSDGELWDEFLVALVTADTYDNDLDAPATAWRIALVSPGQEDRLASEVKLLRGDPTLRTLYPHVGDFDLVYRVRFARTPGAQLPAQFALRLAGPRGLLDFDFGPGSTPGSVPAR